MKKQLLVFVAAVLSATTLAACGGGGNESSSSSSEKQSSSEEVISVNSEISSNDDSWSSSTIESSSIYDPDDPRYSSEPGSIEGKKTFKDALEADYSNYYLAYGQAYNDGSNVEYAYEYYIDGINILLDYTYAEMYGEIVYDFYADYNGDSYAYWKKSDGYEYDGWIANGYRDADLAMYHAYFSLQHLLDYIQEDDVEMILGSYFVKEDRIADINAHCFEFYGDPFMGSEDLTAICFILDDEGRIAKIIGSVSDTSDDGVEIELSQFGTTVAPSGVVLPDAPYYNSDTDRNIYTYPEMKGSEYVPDVWPTALTLQITDDVETESGVDAVIDIDESIDVTYLLTPENANRVDVTWMSTDENVVSTNYKANFTSQHKYISGVSAGTAKVYCQCPGENGTTIKSNILTIKVKELAEQDKTNAVYDLKITGSQFAQNEDLSEDKNVTNIFAYNSANLVENAPYTIKGHNANTLEAKYTDSFGEEGMVLTVTPSSQDYMNSGFYSEVVFDFDDQEVISLSFYYALHKANQRDGAALIDQAYISTSSDGVTWSDPIDMKDEMKSNFEKINLDYLSNKKLINRTFEKATKVKLYFHCSMVGKTVVICMNDFVFSRDDTCHDHVETKTVDVETVLIGSSGNSIKVGGSLQFSVAEILPADATNKNVTWHSTDETVATISETGLMTAIGEGQCEIFAKSINEVESNHVSVTVIGQEKLDSQYVGTKWVGLDVFTNSNFYDLVLTIDSDTSATLSISLNGEKTNLSFTFDTKDDNAVAPYKFVGDNGAEMNVKFYSDEVEVFLFNSIIDLGNTHINTGESLKKYVAASSIVVKNNGEEVGDSVNLYVNHSYDNVVISVNPSNSTYKNVQASVENSNIVSVTHGDYYWTINALAVGSTKITLSNGDGATREIVVNVLENVHITSILLTASTNEMEVGQTLQIDARYTPNNYTEANIVWDSSNKDVATVSSSGLVTGKSEGTTTITCTDTISGTTKSFDVVVGSSTATIPTDLVGQWTGYDEICGYYFRLVFNSDGTGTLSSDDLSLVIPFSFVGQSGRGYAFVTDDGVSMYVEYISTSLSLRYNDGEMDEYDWWQFTGDNYNFEK